MVLQQKIEQFVKRAGRRPRILASSMGKTRHDQDTRRLAAGFAEAGFDVDIGPLKQTPEEAARMAIENDVHIICFLSTQNRHKKLVTDLARVLKEQHAENIRIVIGGAIPRSDYAYLYDAGAGLILNSGRVNNTSIIKLLDLFE